MKGVLVSVIIAAVGWVTVPTALPQEGITSDGVVVMEFHVPVKMRDGVRLSTDIYRPPGPDRYPVIVNRTPYNNNTSRLTELGRLFAENGYVFVTQDCRGRHDSEGEWYPYTAHDAMDGYDTIEWAASQPWSTGKVGSWGASYSAWNQWMAAREGTDHLKAMVSIVPQPDEFQDLPHQYGPLKLPMVAWMLRMAAKVNQDTAVYDMEKLYRHLPLSTVDEAAGRQVSWWKDWLEHDTYDDYWKKNAYMDKYATMKVPVLHIDGWFNDDLTGSLSNYVEMRAGAGSEDARDWQRLIIGPWPHSVNRSQKLGDIDYGPDAVIDMNAVYLRWYGCHLKGEGCDSLATEPRVKYFIMGENRWRQGPDWPLARAETVAYYFRSGGHANTLEGDGVLSSEKPGDESPDRFRYDPADPTPTISREGEYPLGSNEDQRPVEKRRDVLVYTTPPLEESVEVTGPLQVRLWASTSAVDTDWTAKLVDVHPDGYSQRLIEGITRAKFRSSWESPSLIEPGRVYEYAIDLWATSNVFKKGHRIRVEIASANFPKYSRNLNTGRNSETTSEMVVAEQVVHHDAARPSHILLPVVPRSTPTDMTDPPPFERMQFAAPQ